MALVRISITISQNLLDQIDKERGYIPRSKFINLIVKGEKRIAISS